MVRVKRGFTQRRRRKKLFKKAKGFRGSLKRLVTAAKPAVWRAGVYSTRDRKNRKRDFRKLWITRIGIAAKELGISYNKFINGLKKKNILLDRKILADLAVMDKKAFAKIIEAIRS